MIHTAIWLQPFQHIISNMLAARLCMLLLLIVCVLMIFANSNEDEHFHQRSEHHTMVGWQEPGLWRPKWIMERQFITPNGTRSDTIYIKLKNDRTIEFVDVKKRPFLLWRKPGKQNVPASPPQESIPSGKDALIKKAEQFAEDFLTSFGTWWWTDEAPLPTSRVVMETTEGEDQEDNYRYEIRCTWGDMDGYAAKFRLGQIYKYQGLPSGKLGKNLPLNAAHCGFFTLKVNPHRPLVSKDFLAFQ